MTNVSLSKDEVSIILDVMASFSTKRDFKSYQYVKDGSFVKLEAKLARKLGGRVL